MTPIAKLIEAQLANAADLDADDSRPNLAQVWEAIDTPIYHVVDEDGVNVGGALIRKLDAKTWLYVDDSDGYSVLPHSDATNLICVPEAKHVRLGWNKAGDVIEL